MPITISLLKKDGLLLENNKLKGFERLSIVETAAVLRDIMKVVQSSEFRHSPKLYLASRQAERGPTTELRIPHDITHHFISTNLAYFSSV